MPKADIETTTPATTPPPPTRRDLFAGIAALTATPLAAGASPGTAIAANPDADFIRACHAFAEGDLSAWYIYLTAPEDESLEDNDPPPDFDTLAEITAYTPTTPEGWHAKILAFASWDRDSFDGNPSDIDTGAKLLGSILRGMVGDARGAIVARLKEKHGPLPEGYRADGVCTRHWSA